MEIHTQPHHYKYIFRFVLFQNIIFQLCITKNKNSKPHFCFFKTIGVKFNKVQHVTSIKIILLHTSRQKLNFTFSPS